MKSERATWHEFKNDLGAALKGWSVAPLLPLLSLFLFSLSYIPEPENISALPLLLFAAGWPGTERIWYLRIFRGRSISARELWRFTWAFFWRFVRLGFLAAIVSAPVIFLVIRRVMDDPDHPEDVFTAPSIWITWAAFNVVIDFVLTFVTPALAFSTRSVSEALRVGIRTLRDHWPRSAWYAVIPPLAVVLMLRVTAPATLEIPLQVGLSAAGTLLNLLFKGATAAFYLRRVDVGDDGAAWRRNRKDRARPTTTPL